MIPVFPWAFIIQALSLKGFFYLSLAPKPVKLTSDSAYFFAFYSLLLVPGDLIYSFWTWLQIYKNIFLYVLHFASCPPSLRNYDMR